MAHTLVLLLSLYGTRAPLKKSTVLCPPLHKSLVVIVTMEKIYPFSEIQRLHRHLPIIYCKELKIERHLGKRAARDIVRPLYFDMRIDMTVRSQRAG